MIAQLVEILSPLAPSLLRLIGGIIEALASKQDPTQAIRHAEAEAVRLSLHLPLRGEV